MDEIFKKGDRVYHYLYKWGTIRNANKSFASIDFDVIGYAMCDVDPLSFTEYTLEGFSQERPEELPNKGDIVWVRDEDGEHWRVTHFIKKSQDSYWTSIDMQLKTLMPWKQLTTINPTKQ
jgi:hypothetical protein